MIFKTKHEIIYCKDDSYKKEFDNENYYYNKRFGNNESYFISDACYYRGYLVHREDGPAIEVIDNSKCWFLNGIRHRTDGPAIEFYDGGKVWYLNGKRHRDNGPALEYSNGGKEWYLNGKYYTSRGYWKLMNLKMKKKVLYEV